MIADGWNDIVGHDWAKELLAGAIVHGRVGHAYLLSGPTQVGKTMLARTFAQALNCLAEEATARPCGVCRACQLIAADRHPDVRLVEPDVTGRGTAVLRIDQIRQLQQDLSLSAYEGRYKVAIVTRFDAANVNAANAFLKTLEEPPPDVVLLLTAVSADTLLETITSRCRTVSLRPLPAEQIRDSLQTRWHVPADQATLLAHLADGRLGWAITAWQDKTILQTRGQQLGQLWEGINGRRVERFALADKLSRQNEGVVPTLQTWLSWWRDLLVLAQHKGSERVPPLTNLDELERLGELTAVWSRPQILHSLQQTNNAIWQIQRNANTRLVLENLFLVYPPR
ncbi:MAG: DNA polymerase III subunit delta' [Anaerolineales bacterium]|nr:DNA polymerase III subunit delta' [Anaerolineales bacterium]